MTTESLENEESIYSKVIERAKKLAQMGLRESASFVVWPHGMKVLYNNSETFSGFSRTYAIEFTKDSKGSTHYNIATTWTMDTWMIKKMGPKPINNRNNGKILDDGPLLFQWNH